MEQHNLPENNTKLHIQKKEETWTKTGNATYFQKTTFWKEASKT